MLCYGLGKYFGVTWGCQGINQWQKFFTTAFPKVKSNPGVRKSKDWLMFLATQDFL